ncbi:MAG TPA: hypothetical protein VGD89_05115 [Flavipsychrobacter sp.]
MKQKFLMLALCLLAAIGVKAQNFDVINNTGCTIYYRIYNNTPGVCFNNTWTSVLSIPPTSTNNYTPATLGFSGTFEYYKFIFSTNTNGLTNPTCPVQGQVGQSCVPFPTTYTVSVPAGCGTCTSITATWVDVGGNITVTFN